MRGDGLERGLTAARGPMPALTGEGEAGPVRIDSPSSRLAASSPVFLSTSLERVLLLQLARKMNMDAMRFLGFIGIVLAGGVMMAFILELLNSERYDARKERRVEVEPAVRSVATLPAFFAKPQTNDRPPASPGFDEALIAFLEEHVRAEQAMVTKFVHFPSLDSLYRQAKPSATVH